MLWIFVKKIEGGKQLHFSRFDEGFYDFIGKIIHSLIDSKIPKFNFWVLGCLKHGLKLW
jgi:hypothetical protein